MRAMEVGMRRRGYGADGLAVGALACLFLVLSFVVLGVEVVEDRRDGFDRAVSLAVNERARPWLTEAVQTVTHLGATNVAAPLCLAMIAWLAARRRGSAALLVAAVWPGAQVLGAVLKEGFQRARPDFFPHLAPSSGYAFPSGHTTTAVITYGLLAFLLARHLRGRARLVPPILAAVIAGAVGFSRVYLGVHYPTDVIGGVLLAGAWLIVALLALHRLDRPAPPTARAPHADTPIRSSSAPGM
jgi:undecaprenyl-diphosphatase